MLTALRANNFASISLKGIEIFEEGRPPKNNYGYIGKKKLNNMTKITEYFVTEHERAKITYKATI